MQNTVILHLRSPRCPCAGGKSSHLKWKRSICHERMKVKKQGLLILQIPRELLQFSLVYFHTALPPLGCYSSHKFQKQSFSHGLRDALSAERKAENQRPCIAISCTVFEVWTVTEGKQIRVYLQVSPDHIHYLHGDSLWEVLVKKSFFHWPMSHIVNHKSEIHHCSEIKKKQQTQSSVLWTSFYLFWF